jgi:predicted nucleic acid-binding protein
VGERFLDTNILIRHFTQDHDDHSPRSTRLIERVLRGDEAIHISSTVVFEAAFTLNARYKVPRAVVAEALLGLINAPSVICREKAELVETLHLWMRESPLSFADCFHLVMTKSLGLDGIYTFDQKMNRYPGVARIEP